MTSSNGQTSASFWQLWTMSFGFVGVQFGWTLQMANTSAIYEYLGANPEDIPILWLAAPISGLIAQPIIGYCSDRTWTKFGRRHPYILAGALLSSIALILMPNASSLWMAAGTLWILDTSINLTTEPFRAFVADNLDNEQDLTRGFTMQSFFIGCGAVLASLCPWVLSHLLDDTTGTGTVPPSVTFSYYIGAAVFFSAVLFTVLNTKEHPPRPRPKAEEQTPMVEEIGITIREIPATMRELAVVQFFTWLGMFCIFLYLPPAIAHQVFGATSEQSPLYTKGIEWGGICIGIYNFSCFLTSLVLPRLAQFTSRKFTYGFCLFCGGSSLISLYWVRDPYLIFLPMLTFGIAWAGVLSMPYSILGDSLPPRKMGIYMGLFNACIVIPQIIAALGLGWVMETFLHQEHLLVVVLGGFSFLIASVCVVGVHDPASAELPESEAELS
ncbi:MFS transporter [Spirulina major]|uniref:MFS transporter n=1 Tax=Spirulina major TaxID=270636 RepID=UPI001C317DBC|nr:MFS transporter [Spirulina major]